MGVMGFSVLALRTEYLLMTINASRPVFHLIAVFVGYTVTVHFICRMAFLAGHLGLFIVYISLAGLILTQIFIAYPATVAGRANLLHGWSLYKLVRIEKTPSSTIRAADMALAATGMAFTTVIPGCGLDFIPNFRIIGRPGHDRVYHGLGSVMEAVSILFWALVMAVHAHLGFRIGRIPDDSLVCGLPVTVLWISAVAIHAGQLGVMIVLFQNVLINEDFFVRSQRLHLASSTRPLGC